MMSIFTFVLLSTLGLQAYSAPSGKICDGNRVVNYHPTGFVFPSGWSTDQPAAAIYPGQDCKWTVLVPQGKYAKVEAKGYIGNGRNAIEAFYGFDYTDASQEENLVPYYLPAPKFALRLFADVNSTDTYSFKITWFDLPKITGNLFIGNNDVTVKNASEFPSATVVSADGAVSVVVIPNTPVDFKKMRSTLIFDGPSFSSNFMGSIFPIAMSGRQLWGDSKNITIINLNPTSGPQDLIVLQDYNNTKSFNNYAGLECTNGNCNMHAFAPGRVASAFVSASNAKDTITGVDMTVDSTFCIYNGTITPKNLLANYTSDTLPSALPLSFPGFIKQYVFSIHNAAINITRT